MGARGWILAGALLAASASAPPAADSPASARQGVGAAAATPRLVVARRPDGVPAPVIDGVLDDPAWAGATPLGELIGVLPVEGAVPSERTEVHLLYDGRALYLRLLCHDREPSRIRASQMKRDANLDPDDRVEILIDPFLDRRNAFWFQIGAGGSKGDALIAKNGSSFNKQWDGIWEGRARVTARGWEAEMAIPVATLNFDPDGESWGFNLRRHIRRRTEEARWSGARQDVAFFWVSDAGVISGLHGLSQGWGLDLVTFVSASTGRDHTTNVSSDDLDGGLDVLWRMTSDSKLILSYRTDFAETEVDQRQVNLTRFPLFFPEKRRFFLEDSGAFYFGSGGSSQDVIPFFSRRIGLDQDGRQVPLLGAAKYTAQTEGYTIGVLDAQTEASGDLGATNLLSGRFSENLFGGSDAGLIWTHGDPQDQGRADTFGADFNYRTQDFLGDRNLNASTWILGTANDDGGAGDGEGLAGSVGLGYPNDEVALSASATHVDADFDPKLGFVGRSGVRSYEAELAWRPRLNGDLLRRLEFELEPTLVTDTADRLETALVDVQPLGVDFESGERAGVRVQWNEDRLREDFAITDSVTIPVGDYQFVRGSAYLRSSDKRPLSVELELGSGDFYDGRRDDIELECNRCANRHALLGLAYERNDVRLPGGDFVVNVARLELTLLPGPDLSWSQYVQYDDVSEDVSLNSRLWWILQPGTAAFLVFDQGWDRSSGSLAAQATRLIFKLAYTLRL